MSHNLALYCNITIGKDQYSRLLENEFIDQNSSVRQSMNKMHSMYQQIKNHESDENHKKFKDILENKSNKEEWKHPNIYSFKIKQKFKESFVANFVSFQDLQIKYSKNQVDLDKSVHYYVIQLLSNDRLLLKIGRKFSFLIDFINKIKEMAKNDSSLLKIISLYEDYCQIILKEIDLYRILSFPKQKIIEESFYNVQQIPHNQINSTEYTILSIQNNMGLFFEFYMRSKTNKLASLDFPDPNIANLKFGKEIYLRIIHIIINLIINFADYSQNIKIDFKEVSQNLILTIKIKKLDSIDEKEERMQKNITNIEDSFENIINKVSNIVENPFDYHKELVPQSIIYTFKFSKNSFTSKSSQNNHNKSISGNVNHSNLESFNNFRNSKNDPSSNGGSFVQQQQSYLRPKKKEYTFNFSNGYSNEINQTQRPLYSHTNSFNNKY